MGSIAVEWLVFPSYSMKVPGLIPLAVFLCGVCMFSLGLRGFPTVQRNAC
ncbi:hypothetical protein EXN66_Car010486 [Channa argus]|uniref:Uncharacterized protein n=1 Tax=Channa argus TaxID=215402 RepID=A0A6G1PWW0_CHAAH|nr:hypothetical protein EXN66_Car010486 [Channa argus]